MCCQIFQNSCFIFFSCLREGCKFGPCWSIIIRIKFLTVLEGPVSDANIIFTFVRLFPKDEPQSVTSHSGILWDFRLYIGQFHTPFFPSCHKWCLSFLLGSSKGATIVLPDIQALSVEVILESLHFFTSHVSSGMTSCRSSRIFTSVLLSLYPLPPRCPRPLLFHVFTLRYFVIDPPL